MEQWEKNAKFKAAQVCTEAGLLPWCCMRMAGSESSLWHQLAHSWPLWLPLAQPASPEHTGCRRRVARMSQGGWIQVAANKHSESPYLPGAMVFGLPPPLCQGRVTAVRAVAAISPHLIPDPTSAFCCSFTAFLLSFVCGWVLGVGQCPPGWRCSFLFLWVVSPLPLCFTVCFCEARKGCVSKGPCWSRSE